MKEDGTMARRDDLEIFAREEGLKIVFISDIVEYRMQHESLIQVIAESNITFLDTPARRIDFVDHNENHHVAFVFKNNGHQLQNVRFHNIGTDLDLFAHHRYESIVKTVDILKKEGGALIFLEKSTNENPYMKEFGIGAQILKYLGFSEIKLLVTKRKREFVGISGFGLHISQEVEL